MMIIIVLILISILIISLNVIYINTNYHRNFICQLKRFMYMPKDIQIVNIGSGQSRYDFEWSWSSSVRGYNMAVLPEDFRYDFRVLKNYIDNLQKGCIVLQVVSPLSFANNDYLYEYDFSLRYVHVLKRKEVDLPIWRYYLEKYFPVISKPGRIKLLLKKQVKEPLKSDLKMGIQEKMNEADAMEELWLKQNSGLKNLKDGSQAKAFKESFSRNICDLNNIYNYCVKQGLDFYIVIPPISEYLSNKFTVEFLDKFLFDNISSSDIPFDRVINDIFDSEYRELDYYTNGLFLNSYASKKYTKKVYTQISEIYGEK